MRYSLDQLEAFIAVAHMGSFSAAARRMRRTQSTVSVAVANLEVDLHVELFDRSGKLPTLTDSGRKLLAEAEIILERCHDLDKHANNLCAVGQSKVIVSTEITYNKIVAPLAALAEKFPYIELDLLQPISGGVHQLVSEGKADMGIAFTMAHMAKNLAFTQIGKLVLTHVVHSSHPLARKTSVTFSDLHTTRHLIFRAHTTNLSSTEYLRAATTWKAENYTALIEMTRAGLGWATLPRQLILRELESGQFVELNLQAYPHTEWLVGVDLIWVRGRSLGIAGNWLKSEFSQLRVFELDRSEK